VIRFCPHHCPLPQGVCHTQFGVSTEVLEPLMAEKWRRLFQKRRTDIARDGFRDQNGTLIRAKSFIDIFDWKGDLLCMLHKGFGLSEFELDWERISPNYQSENVSDSWLPLRYSKNMNRAGLSWFSLMTSPDSGYFVVTLLVDHLKRTEECSTLF
jgi:hypothetical protein